MGTCFWSDILIYPAIISLLIGKQSQYHSWNIYVITIRIHSTQCTIRTNGHDVFVFGWVTVRRTVQENNITRECSFCPENRLMTNPTLFLKDSIRLALNPDRVISLVDFQLLWSTRISCLDFRLEVSLSAFHLLWSPDNRFLSSKNDTFFVMTLILYTVLSGGSSTSLLWGEDLIACLKSQHRFLPALKTIFLVSRRLWLLHMAPRTRHADLGRMRHAPAPPGVVRCSNQLASTRLQNRSSEHWPGVFMSVCCKF